MSVVHEGVEIVVALGFAVKETNSKPVPIDYMVKGHREQDGQLELVTVGVVVGFVAVFRQVLGEDAHRAVPQPLPQYLRNS